MNSFWRAALNLLMIHIIISTHILLWLAEMAEQGNIPPYKSYLVEGESELNRKRKANTNSRSIVKPWSNHMVLNLMETMVIL